MFYVSNIQNFTVERKKAVKAEVQQRRGVEGKVSYSESGDLQIT